MVEGVAYGGFLLGVEGLHEVHLTLKGPLPMAVMSSVDVFPLADEVAGDFEAEHVDPEGAEFGLGGAADGDLLDAENLERTLHTGSHGGCRKTIIHNYKHLPGAGRNSRQAGAAGREEAASLGGLPHSGRSGDLAVAQQGLDVFLDGIGAVEVVDHHAEGLLQPLGSRVAEEVEALDAGSVAEVEAGHRVEGLVAAMPRAR